MFVCQTDIFRLEMAKSASGMGRKTAPRFVARLFVITTSSRAQATIFIERIVGIEYNKMTRSNCFKIESTAAMLLMLLWSFLLALPVASEDATAPLPPPADAPAPVATTTWSGCVDPVQGYKPVTIGESTTLCLVLANEGDWSTAVEYMRLNFQPTADEYSRFVVPRSFTQLVGNPNNALRNIFSGNITVHAESQFA